MLTQHIIKRMEMRSYSLLTKSHPHSFYLNSKHESLPTGCLSRFMLITSSNRAELGSSVPSVLFVCDTLQLRFIPVYRTIWGKVQILHLTKRVGKVRRTACLRKRLVNPLHLNSKNESLPQIGCLFGLCFNPTFTFLLFYLNSLRIFSAISFISSASSFRCSLRKSTSASLCIGMR